MIIGEWESSSTCLVRCRTSHTLQAVLETILLGLWNSRLMGMTSMASVLPDYGMPTKRSSYQTSMSTEPLAGLSS